jgi:hypothetical protein
MTSVPTHHKPSNTLQTINTKLRYVTHNNCKKYKKTVPNLYPHINSLSQYSSTFNFAIKIFVYGENFFPNGLTTVTFGNIQHINVTYLNSNTIYFELYNFVFPGVYNINVINNINVNAKNTTSNSINGLSLKSNIVQYTIIH